MNFKLLKVLSMAVMVIPIIKIVWLIAYYFGFNNLLYILIGHSIEYDLILLALSFVFRHCLWHKILIFGCILSLLFEYMQEKSIFLSVQFLDFSYVLIGITLIATLTFFGNGVIIKKNNNKRIERVD